MQHDPSASRPAESDNPARKRPNLYGPGRPRVLDDAKRREICALIAGGCGLREAARYVHCSVSTIRREADRNPDFHEQLRRSETYAQLSPLRAMQHAVGTHWRAAAWMLERAFPERFARPEPGAFGARQARQLMNEVLHVVSSEVSDPFKFERIDKRIRGTFEYHIRVATDRHRTTQSLRRAMAFFDQKDKHSDPLAEFGIVTPDFDTLMRTGRSQTPPKANVGHGAPDPAQSPSAGLPPAQKPADATHSRSAPSNPNNPQILERQTKNSPGNPDNPQHPSFQNQRILK